MQNIHFSINLENIVKKYDDTTEINYASLKVKKKGFTIIQGPSGCGKSTLFNIIAGIDRQIYHDVKSILEVNECDLLNISSHNISKMRRSKIGFVFQDYGLLQDFTVKENIMIYRHISKKELNEKLIHFFEELKDTNNEVDLKKIDLFKEKYPYQISGGQQQRVALLRALSHNPKIILADEPTSNVDEDSEKKILEALCEASLTTSIVLITHNKKVIKLLESYGADIDKYVFEKEKKNNRFVLTKGQKTI